LQIKDYSEVSIIADNCNLNTDIRN